MTGCGILPKEEELLAPPLMEPVQVSYSTVKAKRGDIIKTVRGSGRFAALESKYMFFEGRSGRLKDIYVKNGDIVKKGDLLAELYTDDLETEIRIQELNLKKAKLLYSQLKENNANKYELQRAAIDVELAELNLEKLNKQKKQSQLISDMNGVVIYIDNRLGPGDIVNAFQNLIRVADPRELYLEYSGSSISSFAMGAEVDITYKNKQYKGVVVSIPTSVPMDADESLKNNVYIKVSDLPEDVEMGDNAQITLILAESRNTIIVPRQAVKYFMSRRFVNVLEDGLSNERDIEIGIETETEVEILSGVEEGEEIILR